MAVDASIQQAEEASRAARIEQLKARTLRAEEESRKLTARAGRRTKAWHNIGASNGHRRWSASRERRFERVVRAAIVAATEANKMRRELTALEGGVRAASGPHLRSERLAMLPKLNVAGALSRLRDQRDQKQAADERLVMLDAPPVREPASSSPASAPSEGITISGDTPLVVAVATALVGRSGGVGVAFARGPIVDVFHMHVCAPESHESMRKFAEQWARMLVAAVRAPRVYTSSGELFERAEARARYAATVHPEPVKFVPPTERR